MLISAITCKAHNVRVSCSAAGRRALRWETAGSSRSTMACRRRGAGAGGTERQQRWGRHRLARQRAARCSEFSAGYCGEICAPGATRAWARWEAAGCAPAWPRCKGPAYGSTSRARQSPAKARMHGLGLSAVRRSGAPRSGGVLSHGAVSATRTPGDALAKGSRWGGTTGRSGSRLAVAASARPPGCRNARRRWRGLQQATAMMRRTCPSIRRDRGVITEGRARGGGGGGVAPSR